MITTAGMVFFTADQSVITPVRTEAVLWHDIG